MKIETKIKRKTIKIRSKGISVTYKCTETKASVSSVHPLAKIVLWIRRFINQ